MSRTPGSASLAASLEVLAGAPLDAREVVQAKADLTASGSFPYKYIGMEVYVVAENKKYRLIASDPTDLASWEEIGSGSGESIQVSVLPEASAELEGTIYEFVGATDTNYTNGFFYECVSDGAATPTYSWVQKDVQPKQDPVQVETLPNAEPENLGLVLQYIGNTTSAYNHNFFYECVANEVEPVGSEDPSSEGWYELVSGEYVLSADTTVDAGKTYYEIVWQQSNVQPSSSGGGGSLTKQITAAIDVGGIDTGTVYPVDTPIENILSDLLEPTLYPTLTNPSASMTATGAKLLEVGSTLNTTFTITFSRGSISPAYSTSGYRSGVASTYTLDGTTQAGNTFSATITSAKTSYQGSVAYEAGEQPKDSKGQNYDSPLPAGSVNTNTINYEFVNALYANTADITTVAKLALVSKSAKVKQFDFPAQTAANPHEFHVDASWTITAVELLNTLSGQWEDCSSEFTISNTTHDDAAGNPVNYKKYLCNLGIATGDRKIRIKWS